MKITTIFVLSTLSLAEPAEAQYISPACRALDLQYNQQWNQIQERDRIEMGAAYSTAYTACGGQSQDCANRAAAAVIPLYETLRQSRNVYLNSRIPGYTAAHCGWLPTYQ